MPTRTRDQFDYFAQLDRLEQVGQLNRRIQADGSGSATRSSTADGQVPPVSGLTLVKTQGGIELSWNEVNLRDLLRYEVWVATDAAFSTGDTGATGDQIGQYRTRDSKYLLADLASTVTYYVRVRAVNTAGNPGAWSPVGNTTTGLIITADITAGDVAEFVENTQSTGFTTLNTNGEEDQFNYVDVTVGGPNESVSYQFFLTFNYDTTFAAGGDTLNFELELYRRADGATTQGTKIGDTITIDTKSDVPTTGTSSAAATLFGTFPRETSLAAGTYEYSILARVNLTGSSTIVFTATKCISQIRIDKV